MPGEEGKSQGRASRLYCSLSLLEISFYTATWICGVLYSLYTLYLASMDQVLSQPWHGSIKSSMEINFSWTNEKSDMPWNTWGLGGGSGGLTGCWRIRLITNGQHGRYRPVKVRKKNILEKNNISIFSRDLRCLISSLLLADEEIPERLQLNIECKYFEIFWNILCDLCRQSIPSL